MKRGSEPYRSLVCKECRVFLQVIIARLYSIGLVRASLFLRIDKKSSLINFSITFFEHSFARRNPHGQITYRRSGSQVQAF
jgi:hypothetical protein